MKYWIFLHHKCASLYLRSAISAAGQGAGRLTSISALNSIEGPPDENSLVLAHANSDYCLDDNAWPQVLEIFDKYTRDNEWRAVHFVRDPRDLLVSAYWSHRATHPLNFPRLQAHRETLQQVDLESRLLREMDFYLTKAAMEHILYWPEHPSVKTFDAIEVAQAAAAGNREPLYMATAWLHIYEMGPYSPTWQELTNGRCPLRHSSTCSIALQTSST